MRNARHVAAEKYVQWQAAGKCRYKKLRLGNLSLFLSQIKPNVIVFN